MQGFKHPTDVLTLLWGMLAIIYNERYFNMNQMGPST